MAPFSPLNSHRYTIIGLCDKNKCNTETVDKPKFNALHPTDPRTCSRHGTVPMSGLRKCLCLQRSQVWTAGDPLTSTPAVHFTIFNCFIAELISVIPLDVSTPFCMVETSSLEKLTKQNGSSFYFVLRPCRSFCFLWLNNTTKTTKIG